MRNKAKLEGELWDERISSSSGQNSHLVSKATRLWESILARKGRKNEVSLPEYVFQHAQNFHIINLLFIPGRLINYRAIFP
jgi:hypothetical protein